MPVSTQPCPHLIFPAIDGTAAGKAATLDSFRACFRKAGWAATSQYAWATGTYSVNPANGTTVTLDAMVYTFRTTLTGTANQIKIEATVGETLANLARAMTRDPDYLGTGYTATTPKHPTMAPVAVVGNAITVRALADGGLGNDLVATGGSSTWAATGSPTGRLWQGGWLLASRVTLQGYYCRVRLIDPGDHGLGANGNWLLAQMLAKDDTLGYKHWLDAASVGGSYQIVAGPYGFWISVPLARSTTNHNTAVAGGTLYLDQYGASIMPTEVWFSFGDGGGGPIDYDRSPRVELNYSNREWNAEGCWGGHIVNNSQINKGTPRILVQSGWMWKGTVDGPFLAQKTPMRWMNGDTLTYEAYVAWGDPTTSVSLVRGRIYDARIQSLPRNLEEIDTDDDGTEWINYTDNFIKGALFLRRKPASQVVISGGKGNMSYYIKPFYGASNRIG